MQGSGLRGRSRTTRKRIDSRSAPSAIKPTAPALSGEEASENENLAISTRTNKDHVGQRPKMTKAQGIQHDRPTREQPPWNPTAVVQQTTPVVRSEGSQGSRNFVVSKDAAGNDRYIYSDIDVAYDTDDSEAPATADTRGNIPLGMYDMYPHVGYDLDGKQIMRYVGGDALDSLLDSIQLPAGWTGLTDPLSGKHRLLTAQESLLIKRLTDNGVLGDSHVEYPETVETFSSRLEQMPLSAAPEPKRRFAPSKHEAIKIMKLVRAIREGRIQPFANTGSGEREGQNIAKYDVWAAGERREHTTRAFAPKPPLPGFDQSYHPPPEYTVDDIDRLGDDNIDDGQRNKRMHINYKSLRIVPGHETFLKDAFERCLDLYLAPRVWKDKLRIDPMSLLPEVPDPRDLRPFPSTCKCVLYGHVGRVYSIAIDPLGMFIASGGEDGTLRIWSLDSGHELWSVVLSTEQSVSTVSWRPTEDAFVLAAAAGENVFLACPDLIIAGNVGMDHELRGTELLNAGWVSASQHRAASSEREASHRWIRPEQRLRNRGVLVQIVLRSAVKLISWHRRGEYFSTVSPRGQSSAIAIHSLSQHQTQLPFRKLKGRAEAAHFHPSKPVFFVATQTLIRSYDLNKQVLLKITKPGCRWVSSFDVHPGGTNLVVGAYDRRLLWIDMDLSDKPYKTLRYHDKAIRNVKYHGGSLPLFADASDDGTLQVFHGKVLSELENANIVPLKVLRGHKITDGLGVMDLDWHPSEAWLVSAGADGTCRIWK